MATADTENAENNDEAANPDYEIVTPTVILEKDQCQSPEEETSPGQDQVEEESPRDLVDRYSGSNTSSSVQSESSHIKSESSQIKLDKPEATTDSMPNRPNLRIGNLCPPRGQKIFYNEKTQLYQFHRSNSSDSRLSGCKLNYCDISGLNLKQRPEYLNGANRQNLEEMWKQNFKQSSNYSSRSDSFVQKKKSAKVDRNQILIDSDTFSQHHPGEHGITFSDHQKKQDQYPGINSKPLDQAHKCDQQFVKQLQQDLDKQLKQVDLSKKGSLQIVVNKRLSKQGLPLKQPPSKKISCPGIYFHNKDSSFIKQVDFMELPELGELKSASGHSNQHGPSKVQNPGVPVAKKNFSNPVQGEKVDHVVEMTCNDVDEFNIEIEDSDDDQ